MSKRKNKKNKELNSKTLLIKLITYLILIITLILSISFIPKSIKDSSNLYDLAFDNVVYKEESDIALIDYKVYGTLKRMNEGLEVEVPKYKEEFKNENKVLLVKIKGDETKEVVKKDGYYYKEDTKIPNLNIEFYVIKNVAYDNKEMGVDTFITLNEALNKTINQVYLVSMYVIHLLLILILSILVSINITRLIKIKKEKKILNGGI